MRVLVEGQSRGKLAGLRPEGSGAGEMLMAEVESIEPISGAALREGLLAIGNDGTFFDGGETDTAA